MSSFYNESSEDVPTALQPAAFALSELLDGHPVATFVIGMDHVVAHWNKACEHLLGWSTVEMVGTRQHWQAFYTKPRALLADLIVAGRDPATDEHYRGKHSRSPLIAGAYEAEDFFPNIGEAGHWLQFTAAPLRDRDGELVGAIQSLRDVTERRVAENALRRAHDSLEHVVRKRSAQLVQAEKMASIGQLAAGVAHEINNPIGYIFSNFGTLQNYLDDLFTMLDAYQQAEGSIASPEVSERLRALRQQVDLAFLREDIPSLMQESREGIVRVRHIVQDLKDFSRSDARLDWVWANLHHGIDSTLNIVSNEVRYKADVVREFGDIPDIECLPLQLNQVVMNLVVNAAHAIAEGQRGCITLRTGRDGENVWLEVADNGCGIPPEHLNRLFEPFFTTKAVGKGTGLGLSLAYGIVQKHHGRIDVHSTPGQGARFRITLPIRHDHVRDTEIRP